MVGLRLVGESCQQDEKQMFTTTQVVVASVIASLMVSAMLWTLYRARKDPRAAKAFFVSLLKHEFLLYAEATFELWGTCSTHGNEIPSLAR